MFAGRKFTDMTEAQIRAADTSDWIAILPLGAHEQHGPHLPLETDTIIADGIAERLSQNIGPEAKVTFLPTEPIGYSLEHMDYKGSKTLSYRQAIENWIGIGEKLDRLGIRKLMLLNAHGGNSPLMTIVATELRVRVNMLCVATSWTRFIKPGDIVSEQEKAFGIHGGDIETSVMLALAPKSVNMDKAQDFPNFQKVLSEENTYLRAYGPHAFGWKAQDLNEDGVTGNAKAASAKKGRALIAQAVKGLTELVKDMQRFDAGRLE